MAVSELGKERGKKGFQQGFRHSLEARAKISAHMAAYWTAERREAMRGNTRARDARVIGICVYCGAPATCKDHIMPKSRGCDDTKANRAPACRRCNQSKVDFTPEEWFAHMERVLRFQGRWPECPSKTL